MHAKIIRIKNVGKKKRRKKDENAIIRDELIGVPMHRHIQKIREFDIILCQTLDFTVLTLRKW